MLIFRLAMRELRGGLREFQLFLSCLVVGVTVIAAVGILASHVESGIGREAKSLLGGDVEISMSGRPTSPEEQAFLSQWGRVSATLGMRAMATFNSDATLIELKGVDANYPLLGAVELASHRPFAQGLSADRVVIGEDLSERLGVKPGDRLTIGDAPFTVSDILKKEPDRIAGAFSLGPRVMATIADLEKGGLLLPGSLIRYNYRLLLAHPEQLAAFRQELKRRFPNESWIVKTVNESNRTVRELVERLQLFLTLAGLSSLLIGGVGILNAAESYIGGKTATIAVFKVIGATRATVLGVYATVLALVSLLGMAISAGLSLILSWALLPFLAQFLPVSAGEAFDAKPLLLAASFGILTVFTFSFAALACGVEVKPAMLFRGMGMGRRASLPRGPLVVNILLAAALITLVVVSASDRKIAAGFILAALVCFCLFTVCARALGLLARRVRLRPGILRLGVASLYRPDAPVFSIMLGTGLGLSVLLALLQVEGNIERDIRESIPGLAPSLFLIDIQPDERQPLLQFLAAKSYVSHVASQPMVRGRIAKLKGLAVEAAPISDEAKWATESDRGLSFAATPPEGTKITQGTWWPPGYSGKTLVSFDRKLAEGMGLKVGDTITLNILGETLEATIANLREVNYMSLGINFAMILSPGKIEHFPSTTIATLRVEGEKNETALVREITKQFSNVSSIRIRESLAQLDLIVGHIVTAIRLTALFTFISAAVVLLSTLSATLAGRAYDTTVFKVLGARRRDILAMFMTEWLAIAAVTGLLSCLFGTLGAWLITGRLHWVEFHPLMGPMLGAMLFALAFIALSGLLLHSRAFGLKANVILRNE